MPNSLKNIRQELGMGQALLASYLGIARPTLALVETRKRSLPTAALIKLNTLLQRLAATNLSPSAKALESLNRQGQKQMAAKHKRLARTGQQLLLLQQQLDTMKQQYRQCMNALETAAYALARLSSSAADRKDKETMQLLELEAIKKVSNCSPAKQAWLALDIQLLQKEIELIGKLGF